MILKTKDSSKNYYIYGHQIHFLALASRKIIKSPAHIASASFSVIFLLCILVSGCSKEKKPRKVSSREKMQELVINISGYCKKNNPDFIVIPQNASELAFKSVKNKEVNQAYMNAVDGFGVESLYYNAEYDPDTIRIDNLKKLKLQKPVLVSEYIAEDKNIGDAKRKNKAEGFICFPRIKKNYNYEYIPSFTNYENADDITAIGQIKNYLYLINPVQYNEKADFIKAVRKTNFDMIIMDLFFNNNEPFTSAEIAQLKKKSNGGKRLVVCYLNIGSAENWRYYWRKTWKLHSPDFLEKEYEGYDNEFWVKFWDRKWQKIIYGNDKSYTKKIIDAGFDGIYMDNVEAYRALYH